VRAKSALDKLAKGDREQPLQCALHGLLAEPTSLDARINVVGAQHQALWLRNRIEPYLREFGSHDEAWMNRCLDRVLSSEGDDWAVRALLFSPAPELLALVHRRTRRVVFAATQTSSKGETTESVGLANRWVGGVAVDYLRISWRQDAHEVVEVQYAKSASLPRELCDPLGLEPPVPLLGGRCVFGRFWAARLPYGAWHWFEDYMTLQAQEETQRCLAALPEWVHSELAR